MLLDRLKRPIRDLRVSVTDRCDFRCTYCMPYDKYEWIKREEILSFEEIARIVAQFASLGVEKIRLTGGEPLLRSGVCSLVEKIAATPGIRDLRLTTNASRLVDLARPLRDAGLRRINVSLDTLDEEKFRRITKRDGLDRVIAGIDAAVDAGFRPLKINMVVENGVNEDEILPMVDFCRERDLSLRFIEFMDVGNANTWDFSRVVPARLILDTITSRYSLEDAGREQASDTATRYRFADGSGDIAVIASVTRPFCTNCSRARVTAEGKLVTCLFSSEGTDLKALVRGGISDEHLRDRITDVWKTRNDRYSEERLEAIRADRYDPKQRSKIEMITLGG